MMQAGRRAQKEKRAKNKCNLICKQHKNNIKYSIEILQILEKILQVRKESGKYKNEIVKSVEMKCECETELHK